MSLSDCICRICLESCSTLKSMEITKLDHQTYQEIYEICTKYKVENDIYHFPISICEECESELLQCYAFVQKCVTSEIFLLKRFLEEELAETETNICAQNEKPKLEVDQLEFDFVSVDMIDVDEASTSENFKSQIPNESNTNQISPKKERYSQSQLVESNNEISDTDIQGEEYLNDKSLDLNIPFSDSDDQENISQDVADDVSENTADDELMNEETASNSKDDEENIDSEAPKVLRKFRGPPIRSLNTKRKRVNNMTPSLCPVCGKTVAAYRLRVHLSIHREKDPTKTYPCKLCTKVYRNPNFLRIHIRNHYDIKHYKCEYCDERFNHWNTKNSHVITYHTGAANYSCSLCQAQFVVKQKYTAHMRQHTGAPVPKKFPCPDCDKKFDSMYSVRKHAVVHTGERKYKCGFCDKTYKQYYSLKTHIDTNHGGEKNYECPVCREAFAHNSSLRNHCQKNHPDYQLPPPGTVINKKSRERIQEHMKKRVIYNPFYNDLLKGKTLLNSFTTNHQPDESSDIDTQ